MSTHVSQWKPRQLSVQAILKSEDADKKREEEAKKKWLDALKIKDVPE